MSIDQSTFAIQADDWFLGQCDTVDKSSVLKGLFLSHFQKTEYCKQWGKLHMIQSNEWAKPQSICPLYCLWRQMKNQLLCLNFVFEKLY